MIKYTCNNENVKSLELIEERSAKYNTKWEQRVQIFVKTGGKQCINIAYKYNYEYIKIMQNLYNI